MHWMRQVNHITTIKKNDVYWVKYGNTITEHINNILKSGELETDTVGKIDVDNFKNCKDI